MRYKHFLLTLIAGTIAFSCSEPNNSKKNEHSQNTVSGYDPNFKVSAQEFADLKVLRYQVPGFDELPLQQKILAYYLSEAALSGRDII
ncbi:MAG TPA: hypothetical protein PLC76_06950 [Saprospiraceae bacterium]|nr:hypothetical protein [Saprospiraceae bacterium]HRP84445.1 hypothetical protein [Saprospiraceae bacterium]